MPDSIDHLVIACPDPAAAAGEIEARLGLRATGSGRHAALGTFNRLVWLGDGYIELVGVWDAGLAAASWIGQPVIAANAAGGGLATWAAGTSQLEVDVQALRSGGSGIGEPQTGERIRPDGRVVRWTLACAIPLGPLMPPFLIEHDMTAAEWTEPERAERAEQRHPLGGPARLSTLQLPAADLPGVTRRYLRTVGIGPFRPSLAGHGAREAPIGPHAIRFMPAQVAGWPMATIHLRVELPGEPAGRVVRDETLLGCHWIIRTG
ncbi:MAG: VOC family protein [Candidatus Limnocylindrales bacterium]